MCRREGKDSILIVVKEELCSILVQRESCPNLTFGCSFPSNQDYGEDSEGLHIVKEYFKSQ